ncbi:ParA family protein [Massilia sp. NEAU-DD11]|uniref:ParA family protein n=1 Tax=Massilia cellulosiltytica TaxID=2683234 RepID=A0A7X3KBM0_9BURK|nr:ParA family protein [Telluria cellulosilytica]MVW64535.1 ParA family protein [Telluria cellulosilytica]
MPTIVFVSPKGGAGKTTSALVLAEQLARSADVTVIDADPNRPIENWAKGGAKPDRMTIVADADEENVIERIEEAAARTPFVIVDLEGTAAKIVVMAVSQADFVIVPTQGSQLDAEQAGRAFRVIQQQEKMVQRRVPGYRLPYSVLLTRTNSAIRTRTLAHIEKGLVAAGIPVFETELNEREAFRSIFSFRKPLAALNPSEVANLDKAVANAEQFAQEVIAALRKVQQQASEVSA